MQTVNLKHKTKLNFVEIELTTKCNLKCFACNRICSQAPSNEEMSLQQIKKFIIESEDYPWKSIAIMGGEPLLHTQIDTVLSIFSQYKKRHRNCNVKVITNGTIKKIKIPGNLELYSSQAMKRRERKGYIDRFGNCLLAPIDRIKPPINTCKITATCGLGLSRYGYFPCGCAASIARVMRRDIGVKNLKEVNKKNMDDMLLKMCQYCGRNLEYQILLKKDKSISLFWENTLHSYEHNKHLQIGLY